MPNKPLICLALTILTVGSWTASGSSALVAPARQDAPETWKEHWFEHNQLLKRVADNRDVAVYFDDDVTREGTEWVLPFLTKLWRYTKATYGPFGNEGSKGGRLYGVFHEGKYSGGHPSTYVDASHDFRNVIDCGPGPFTTPKYDVPSHEVAHIVEGASRGIHGSPGWDVWGDSKWAEFFQYDAYKALGMEQDAQRLHAAFSAKADSFPRPNTYWFRDWFYPLWRDHGHAKVMVKFFELASKHFPTKKEDANSGTKPETIGYTRSMNWGEYVHFMSGAAGKDLKPLAEKAFGWPADREAQYQKARADFPGVKYRAAKPGE
jgi:hypothetical protein